MKLPSLLSNLTKKISDLFQKKLTENSTIDDSINDSVKSDSSAASYSAPKHHFEPEPDIVNHDDHSASNLPPLEDILNTLSEKPSAETGAEAEAVCGMTVEGWTGPFQR
jgi:hypothetical protein